jgi:hypothetical protein
MKHIKLSRSIFVAFLVATLITFTLISLGILRDEWMPVFTRRYLDNNLCNLILFVALLFIIYALFQKIGLWADKACLKEEKNEFSVFLYIICYLTGRDYEDNTSDIAGKASDIKPYREIDDILTPLNFGVWLLPILGFIGTVIGITEAIGGLEPLLKMTTQNNNIGNSMGEVIGGLKYAFDTTLIGLVLVIPVMLSNIYLRIAISRFDMSSNDKEIKKS